MCILNYSHFSLRHVALILAFPFRIIAEAEKCAGMRVVKGQNLLTIEFKEELKHLKDTICDPGTDIYIS